MVGINGVTISNVTISGTNYPNLMCVGDSLTVGFGNGLEGFRLHLQPLLDTKHALVGPYSDPDYDSVYYVHHAGIGGNTPSDVLSRIQSHLDAYFPLPKDGSIILLDVGVNDTSQVNLIEDIIDIIDSHDSTIDLYVALITPITIDDDNITAFNVSLSTILDNYVKANLYKVDLNTAFKDNPTWADDYMYDVVHPNDAGYVVMATTWGSAINAN